MNRTTRLIASALLLAFWHGCAAAPINKPIKVGDVDTGTNSLEAVRRQFEGTWALDHYYVYEGTRRRRLDATAELKYDEFGNLTMRGQLKNATAATSAAELMLNYTGRAVIDVNSKQLRMMAVTNTGDSLPSPIEAKVDPASVRHYEFQGSELWLTVNGADGKPTASSSWKKIQ
jgi:hypothetical protein